MRYLTPILVIIILTCFSSCIHFKQVAVSKEGIPESGYYFIVHQKQQQWFMYDVSIKNDTVSGTICSVIDKSLEAYFVHLYVSSELVIPDTEHSELVIPYTSIYTAEINKKDRYKTNTLSIAAGGFFLILTALAFVLMTTI